MRSLSRTAQRLLTIIKLRIIGAIHISVCEPIDCHSSDGDELPRSSLGRALPIARSGAQYASSAARTNHLVRASAVAAAAAVREQSTTHHSVPVFVLMSMYRRLTHSLPRTLS